MSTAEIRTAPMSETEARAAVDTINNSLKTARNTLYQLYVRKGWEALGYATWRECVTAEFQQGQRILYYELQAAQIEIVLHNCANAEIGSIPEGKLRPLAPLRDRPDVLRAVWGRANERADGNPTGRDVLNAVDEVLAEHEREESLFPELGPEADSESQDEPEDEGEEGEEGEEEEEEEEEEDEEGDGRNEGDSPEHAPATAADAEEDEGPGPDTPDYAAKAQKWQKLLVKLRDDMELVINGIRHEEGLRTSAPKWFHRDLRAIEEYFRELRDTAEFGIKEFRSFRQCAR